MKRLVVVLGMDPQAKPIQIVEKSIRNVKEKSYSIGEFAASLEDESLFMTMKNLKIDFAHKNTVAIPNFLTKAFVSLNNMTHFCVLESFVKPMFSFDNSPDRANLGSLLLEESDIADNDDIYDQVGDSTSDAKSVGVPAQNGDKTSTDHHYEVEPLLHVIQFCHLCTKGKIPPVLYSLASNQEIDSWFSSLPVFINPIATQTNKHQAPPSPADSHSHDTNSPLQKENKSSRKDDYLINTMIKLHDTMDKNSKTRKENDPGFHRLESHQQRLILHASTTHRIPPVIPWQEEPVQGQRHHDTPISIG